MFGVLMMPVPPDQNMDATLPVVTASSWIVPPHSTVVGSVVISTPNAVNGAWQPSFT